MLTKNRRAAPTAKQIASGSRKSKPKTSKKIEYHVVPEGRRWNVERDEASTGQFAFEVNTAIGIAIHEAQRDHHNGLDATVCVQHADGTCRHVWP